MKKITSRGLVLGVATVTILALVGCSTPKAESTSTGDREPVTLEVGTLPVIETALLMVGEQQGFFSDRGIKLNYTYAQGGAAIVPGVVSNQYQLGYSNSVSVLQAMEKGLPLSLLNVSAASNGNPEKGTNDLIVRDDGSIKTVADLEGKKVAVNTLGNLSDVLAKSAVDAGGADSSKVQFVELGFGDMIPALKSGNIDAFLSGEPFGTISKSQGYKTLVNTHQELSPNDHFIFGVWFVNTAEANKAPDLYSDLQEAINASNKYANAHLDEVRAMVPKVTTMDAAVLAKINLNDYSTSLTAKTLKPLTAAAVKYKLLKAEPDYGKIIWKKP